VKNLLIKLDETVLFDGEVAEFQWSESDSAVAAKGALRRQPGGGGKGLLDALAAAAKAKPAAKTDAVETIPDPPLP